MAALFTESDVLVNLIVIVFNSNKLLEFFLLSSNNFFANIHDRLLLFGPSSKWSSSSRVAKSICFEFGVIRISMNIEKLSLSDFCAAELVANEWLPIVYAGAATFARMTENSKTE